MALFPDPFEALVRLQQTMDTLRSSDWLNTGPSAAGAFPPVNAFRKGDDYMLIAELPGVDRDSVDIQVKGNTIRLSGRKARKRWLQTTFAQGSSWSSFDMGQCWAILVRTSVR